MIDKKKAVDTLFKLLSLLKNKFIFYAQNCTVAGLNYLFEENAPLWGRLFWLIILIASGFFAYFLIIPVIELDNEINFTIDTRYLNWSTKFAAVTVCEDLYTKEAQRKLEASSLFKKHLAHLKLSYGHKKYLTELMFGRGSCINDFCSPCGRTIPCDVPWREIIEQIHMKCEGLIAKCEYNGVPISCCEYFHKVDSEFGSCFAFNSLQSKNVTIENLFYVNRTTGPSTLSFYVPPNTLVVIKSHLSWLALYLTIYSGEKERVMLKISGPHLMKLDLRIDKYIDVVLTSSEELATSSVNNKFKRRIVDRNTEIIYSLTEMENDPLLYEEYIKDRFCRFLDEIPDGPLHKYKTYSYRACKLAEDTEHVYEHCGCISPTRDLVYKKYFCKNYTALNCLVEFQEKLRLGLDVHDTTVLKKSDCLASCVESEVFVLALSTSLKAPPDAPGLWVVIKMVDLPHMRFRRNVLRTDLDIVVSIGGIIGLLFCASILSLVEFIYLFLRKLR